VSGEKEKGILVSLTREATTVMVREGEEGGKKQLWGQKLRLLLLLLLRVQMLRLLRAFAFVCVFRCYEYVKAKSPR
jgi:hypothetical protein